MMALSKAMVKNAATTPVDVRKADAGRLVKNADGTARTGVLGTGFTTIVAGRAAMSVDVRAAAFVTSKSRADGAAIFDNDGTVVFAPAGWTAPTGVNPRIDVVWIKSFDDTTGDPAGQATPQFGITYGDEASIPTEPSIPTGATKLASVRLGPNITTTSAATITQTYDLTVAEGGIVPFRSLDDLRAWAGEEGALARVAGGGPTYRRSGTSWIPYIGPVWAQRVGSSSLPQGLSGTNLRTLAFSSGVTVDDDVIELGVNAFIIRVAGWYDLEATINWENEGGSYRILELQKNGAKLSPSIADRRPGDGTAEASIKGRVFLQVDDIIRLAARQEVKATLNYQCTMTATFVSGGP